MEYIYYLLQPITYNTQNIKITLNPTNQPLEFAVFFSVKLWSIFPEKSRPNAQFSYKYEIKMQHPSQGGKKKSSLLFLIPYKYSLQIQKYILHLSCLNRIQVTHEIHLLMNIYKSGICSVKSPIMFRKKTKLCRKKNNIINTAQKFKKNSSLSTVSHCPITIG